MLNVYLNNWCLCRATLMYQHLQQSTNTVSPCDVNLFAAIPEQRETQQYKVFEDELNSKSCAGVWRFQKGKMLVDRRIPSNLDAPLGVNGRILRVNGWIERFREQKLDIRRPDRL